jgi:hypothetical protein
VASPRALLAVVAAVLLLVGCGEPPVDLDVPRRGADQHVLDEAGILDASIEERLAELSEDSGYDVVALAFTDDRSSLGQADRGGRMLLREWGADIVLVAVARPDDFTSTAEDRSRFFGVFSADRFDVSRDLRERIIFDAVQRLAAENEWTQAFHAGIAELEAELATQE